MRQVLIAIFGLLALLCFWGAADTRLHLLNPMIHSETIDVMSPIEMPLHLPTQNRPATYMIAGDFVVTPFTHRVVTIVPDDCLRRLTINSVRVDLSAFAESQLCDIRNGVTLNLGSEVHLGINHMEASIEDFGGWYGLSVEARPSTAWRIFMCVFGLVFACGGLMYLNRVMISFDVARRQKAIGWTIIFLSTALSILMEYVLHRPADFIYSDMAAFAASADHFKQGIVDPYDLFKPTGFGILLAICDWIGDRYLILSHIHVLSFLITLWCTWRATAVLFSERIALLTLAVAAIHLPFLNFTGFAIPEATFTAAIAVLYWLIANPEFFQNRARQVFAGMAVAVGFLLKGNIALFPIVFCGWLFLWYKNTNLTRRNRFNLVVMMFLGSAMAILPVSLFLKSRLDTYNVVPTSGGLNFVEGKCPSKRNFDSNGANWMSPLFVQLNEREEKHWDHPFTDSAFYWREGLKCIANEPMVLMSSVRYVYYLFFDNMLWPDGQGHKTSRFYHMLFSAFYVPGFLVGLLIILRKPRTFNSAPFLLILALFLCSYLIKSELRYRIPFDVVILPLVVLGWDRIFDMTKSGETKGLRIQRVMKWSYFALASVLVIGLLCEI